MISVDSTVHLSEPAMRDLEKAAIEALVQTAEQIHTEVVQAQVMPRDTGALQNESTFVDDTHKAEGTVSLVSSTPYARRLYFHPEYHFSKEANPNAKGRWLEDWADIPEGKGTHSERIRAQYAEFYRRLAGL